MTEHLQRTVITPPKKNDRLRTSRQRSADKPCSGTIIPPRCVFNEVQLVDLTNGLARETTPKLELVFDTTQSTLESINPFMEGFLDWYVDIGMIRKMLSIRVGE